MNSRVEVGSLVVAVGLLCGCGAEPGAGSNLEIDVEPATLEEANASLDAISQLEERGERDAALQALAALRPRLDELNGMIVRIEPETGRFITFYEPEPGHVLVSEKAPKNVESWLRTERFQGLSVLDTYRVLTRAEPPEALVEAHARQQLLDSTDEEDDARARPASGTTTSDVAPRVASGIGTSQEALTAADGEWFRDHGCFVNFAVDMRACLPNWGGGGWAEGYTKTSFLTVAPFSGEWLSVRLTYSSQPRFTEAVFNGEWLSWWYHSSTSGDDYNRRTHRWDVLNASDNGFHWSYAYKWSCTSQKNCNFWPSPV